MMIRRPGSELARDARDWLRRRPRSGARPEVLTCRPSADRARRPDGFARHLLDRLEAPKLRAEDCAHLAAEALRRRAEAQLRPRGAPHRPGLADPPSADVRLPVEIGQAWLAIAHPELGIGPRFAPSPRQTRARRSPDRGIVWLAGGRFVLAPAAAQLTFSRDPGFWGRGLAALRGGRTGVRLHPACDGGRPRRFRATARDARLGTTNGPVLGRARYEGDDLMMDGTIWLRVGGTLGALAVAAGAFGAHALEGRVAAGTLTARQLATFETAAKYQMYHALALVAAGLLALRTPGSPAATAAGWSFLAGVVLFSGSLYALVLTGQKWLGMITPIGGVAFIAGWLALAAASAGARGGP